MKTLYAGIDIGGTNVKLAVVSPAGRVIASEMIRTRPADGPETAFHRIRTTFGAMLGRGDALAAAGVGVAGLVESRKGILRSAPNLREWENQPIGRIAKKALGVDVLVDNDANAAAYGEFRKGCGRGAKMFICLTLGTGVGGAIVSEGELVRGAKNYAGEIGHMTVDENGPRCKCGNRGCIEAFVGASALVQDAETKLRTGKRSILRRWLEEKSHPLTPRTIAQAAKQGDRLARSVFDDAGAHLGTAIASLVNMLNPDVVGVAGGVAEGFDLMKTRVKEVVRERAFPECARGLVITRGSLGFDAATIGSAMLAKHAIETRTAR